MQLTYHEPIPVRLDDEFAPEQTRNIPFLGFAAATVLSAGIWAWVAWAIWVMVK